MYLRGSLSFVHVLLVFASPFVGMYTLVQPTTSTSYLSVPCHIAYSALQQR